MTIGEAIAEIAGIYIDTINRGHGVITRFEQGNRAAEAILAAGYRKTRTITTTEELDALLGSAVVKDSLGQVFEKQEAGQWYDGPHDWLAFDGKFWDVDAIHFPATVLYEPQP